MATTTLRLTSMLFPAKIRRFLPSKSFCLQLISAGPLSSTNFYVGTYFPILPQGTLATTGDLICQKLVEKRDHIDAKRTTRFALTTMLIIVRFCQSQTLLI
jgi:hypothetical protein